MAKTESATAAPERGPEKKGEGGSTDAASATDTNDTADSATE